MKLQGHSNTLTTNTKVKSQDFGIGDASVVIEILRNRLYQFPIRTLVQEYLCNARDASRETKATKPIQVTAPTSINPTFKVRDFGPGIDPDRMKNVFVMYGSSTKRDSNNQTGGFGIGAKSAWSYTDSFTIVTHVDGVKRSYVAHTGVNNNGRLDLIGQEKTTEVNGTEIQIAVKPNDVKYFTEAIFRAIKFWKPSEKPKLLGTTVEFNELKDKQFQLNETMEFILESKGAILLAIDGVQYEVSREVSSQLKQYSEFQTLAHGTFVIHLPNGMVEIAASRESIANTPVTRDVIDEQLAVAVADLKKLLSKLQNSIKTLKDCHVIKQENEWFLNCRSIIMKALKLAGTVLRIRYSALKLAGLIKELRKYP